MFKIEYKNTGVEFEDHFPDLRKMIRIESSIVMGILNYKKGEINMEFGKCKECENGKYVIRNGEYNRFSGCNNYPKCKSTITIAEYIKRYLEEEGVKIYRWKKTCPRCKKETNVISYFLNYELEKCDEVFEMVGNIGIGDIPFIDKLLMVKYKNIKLVKSKTINEEYVANICEHCGCLQGHNYVVDDPHEIWEDLYHEKTMEKYLYDNINVKGTFIPYKELNII